MNIPKPSVVSNFSFLLLIAMSVLSVAADVIDTSFDAHLDTATFVNKRVTHLVALPTGKMIAAGAFNKYNGRNVGALIRVNTDGSLDNSFNNDLLQGGVALGGNNADIIVLPDGKLLLKGTFTLTDGTAYTNQIIRLNENGTIDQSFVFEPTGVVRHVKLDASGRLLAVGGLQYVRDGQTINKELVRLTSSGAVDTTFNAQNPTGIDRFETQGNKIVYSIMESSITQIRRLNEDGSFDNSFTQTAIGNWFYFDIAAQSDNKILFLRETTVVRVNADGGVDNTFQNPTFGGIAAQRILVLSDDRFTVGFGTGSAPFGLKVVRMLASGAPDPTFTPYLHTPSGDAVYEQHANGSVMIGDAGLNFSANTFVKLLPGGQADPTYNSGGIGFQNIRPGKIRSIRVLASNKILIGGDFDRVNSVPRNKIALLNHNSTLDPSFQINTTPSGNYFSQINDVYDIEIQSDGKMLVSGNFSYVVNGGPRSNVVRLNQNGSIDASFVLGPQINDHFVTSRLSTNRPFSRPDGKIVISNSKTFPGDPQPPIQLTTGGTADASFTPTLFVAQTVIAFDLAVLNTGKILVIGRRSYLESGTNTVTKGFVARLNADGTTDGTFQIFELLNKSFVSGRVLTDGRILVIHRSDTGSQVYRLNADGTLDDTFNSGAGANGRLNSMAVLQDGRIVVGGSFTSYNGDSRRNLVVLSVDGNLLPRHLDTNKEVLCLSLDNSGRVLVGGFFTSLQATGQQPVEISYLARLNELTSPTPKAPFDFDGDGKTDLGIFRPGVGEWWINRSSSGSTFAAQFGASTDKIVPADFTGDGKTDVAFWRPATGEWFVLRSEDSSFFSFPFGASEDIPVPADYDADGKADPAVFRPSTATWYIQRSSDNGTTIAQFGATGDHPVAADYDGDGRADLAIYRPSNGQWWLNRSTAGVIAMAFGNATDKTVPGDYTGDGKADVAFWRESTGEWFIQRSEDSSYYSVPFGTSGDIAAPGDFDGDGKIDTTVFRPSSATWFSQRSTAGTLIQQFGANGDQPLPNAYVR